MLLKEEKKNCHQPCAQGERWRRCADELSFQKIIWGDHDRADPSLSCGEAQSEEKIIAGMSDTPMEGICPPVTGGFNLELPSPQNLNYLSQI